MKNKVIEGVEVIDMGTKGKGVAKKDGMVIFVQDAIPGDVVDVLITKKKKSFMEGKVDKYISRSKDLVEPFCQHFDICGGCSYQHMDYKAQLFQKQKGITDNLARIGKLELPEPPPIIGCESTQFYRNKLEFTFSNKRWLTLEEIQSDVDFGKQDVLGFHIPGRFDKILNVEKCWLQADPSNAIRNEVLDYSKKNELEFFDLREQTGLLRNMIIRTTTTNEVMVIMIFAKEDRDVRVALLDHLGETFPEITSLMFVINGKRNDTISDLDVHHYTGRMYITEKLGDVSFKIGPKSFFQTNSTQANKFYQIIEEPIFSLVPP